MQRRKTSPRHWRSVTASGRKPPIYGGTTGRGCADRRLSPPPSPGPGLIDELNSIGRGSLISSDWDRAIVHSSWLNWAFAKESYAVARLLFRERHSPLKCARADARALPAADP